MGIWKDSSLRGHEWWTKISSTMTQVMKSDANGAVILGNASLINTAHNVYGLLSISASGGSSVNLLNLNGYFGGLVLSPSVNASWTSGVAQLQAGVNSTADNIGTYCTMTVPATYGIAWGTAGTTWGTVTAGTWRLGNSSLVGTNGVPIHSIRASSGGGGITLLIQGNAGGGSRILDVGYGSGAITNGIYATHNSFGYVADTGAWILGPTGSTVQHIINGNAMSLANGSSIFTGTVTATTNFGAACLQVGGPSNVSAKGFIGLGSFGGGGCGLVFTRGNNYDTSVQVYTNASGNAVSGGLGTAGPYVASAGVSWTNGSDIRLKNIIRPIENALEKISNFRTIVYSRKDDCDNTPHLGLIAQDVQQTIPEVINTNSEGYLGIEYSSLVPVLVKAIKELQEQINLLKQA